MKINKMKEMNEHSSQKLKFINFWWGVQKEVLSPCYTVKQVA